jgi:hypothetical protein
MYYWVLLSPNMNDSDELNREWEANARLIAAAPCLYRELERLVSLMEPLEREGSLNIPGLATLNGARAVLQKATEGQ